MSAAWRAELRAEADRFREDLVALGFSDDGEALRGELVWLEPSGGSSATAVVEVEIGELFPYGPPTVRVLDPGNRMDFTFHLDPPKKGHRVGTLCLWDIDWPVDQAPWRQPGAVLERVRQWLAKTAAGWPGDTDCDLERYLPADATVVLYDGEALAGIRHPVRTQLRDGVVTITTETRKPHRHLSGGRRSRKDSRLAVCSDVGELSSPIRNWSELAGALGAEAARGLARSVHLGVVEYLLIRYTRGGHPGAVVLRLRPAPEGAVRLAACESADFSAATRNLRAGLAAQELADVKVAIAGVGAVGSFLADILYRSGVRRLTLIDDEVLRPGNVVRHLADDRYVGLPKGHAVRARLQELCLGKDEIISRYERVESLGQVLALLSTHDLVVDATANARATSLLTSATRITNAVVLTACVQRDGAVVRVDRFPLRGKEHHLPALVERPGDRLPRERGCGNPVSRTPPGAVYAAAELAARIAIDEVTLNCAQPASVAEVRTVQAESPFDVLGRVVPPGRTGIAS